MQIASKRLETGTVREVITPQKGRAIGARLL
jgi:hypothetical protein